MLAVIWTMVSCTENADQTGSSADPVTAETVYEILPESETTAETVLDSLEFIQTLSNLSGLPVWLHTAQADVAARLSESLSPVFPLQLQEKYFDLPSQKPANRPLWG